MTSLSEQILESWQVRKTKKQKTAFIEFMQSQIPDLRVEAGGFGNNRNLVLGDVKSAKVIFTAHYDTCARMFLPNFITPKNILFYFAYALMLCIPVFVAIALLNFLLGLVTDNFWITYWGSLLPGLALMFGIFMGGKPNPHTVNDNTSGVITLCELMAAMTDEQKAQTAFVFFDNEEVGLLGSAYFRKLHRTDGLEKTLLLNYDCVSDGDHILLVQSAPVLKAHGASLAEAFPSTASKTVHLEKSSTTMYPSDQANFPMGVGVAALKKKKYIGLYLDRIHTVKDTVFQEENITFLVAGTLRLLDHIL